MQLIRWWAATANDMVHSSSSDGYQATSPPRYYDIVMILVTITAIVLEISSVIAFWVMILCLSSGPGFHKCRPFQAVLMASLSTIWACIFTPLIMLMCIYVGREDVVQGPEKLRNLKRWITAGNFLHALFSGIPYYTMYQNIYDQEFKKAGCYPRKIANILCAYLLCSWVIIPTFALLVNHISRLKAIACLSRA